MPTVKKFLELNDEDCFWNWDHLIEADSDEKADEENNDLEINDYCSVIFHNWDQEFG